MKNKIGVMQGRLLPKYKGRYQAHPVGCWQEEFSIAQKMGLDCIEFILDYNDSEKNPLLCAGGVDQINDAVQQSGVKVKTICADYFMEAPLHSSNNELALRSQGVLRDLLGTAEKLGVTDIVIPCVDQSSLSDKDDVSRFVENLYPLIEISEKNAINFSLETDLAPQPFIELLDKFDAKRVTVNYDIGNSAALGFDPVEELDTYGHLISDIHIKDRRLGGGPVVLGEGAANFDLFFNKLKSFEYTGSFIMQAYRDDEGIDIFKKQLTWIMPYIEALSSDR